MSARKYIRQMVRAQAEKQEVKASRAVSNWRVNAKAYPGFVGKKRKKPGSRQPILIYPIPKGGAIDKRNRERA